ncbi:hypothetical protein ATANTOWER_026746 [Ataeniobius toweri]|uniref:Uncharacterized protein n=1 Tax=Ataeniobius toweri TaxID=208326 RepID=A0ABU7C5F8_9TELE|nr:hypothetical protein [Ataeniobius toweri]
MRLLNPTNEMMHARPVEHLTAIPPEEHRRGWGIDLMPSYFFNKLALCTVVVCCPSVKLLSLTWLQRLAQVIPVITL